MEMPKQMEGGASERHEQIQQQGQSETARNRRKPDPQIAETPAEQMRPMHFSDWASI